MTLAIVAVLGLSRSATAQDDSEWSLWLYNPEHHVIAQVMPGTGAAEVYEVSSLRDFPVETNSFSDQDVAVNADSRRVAYCSVEATELCGENSNSALIIHDLDQDNIATYACLPRDRPCYFGEAPWSGNRVAFSYDNGYLPRDIRIWAIQVLDSDKQTISIVFDQFDDVVQFDGTLLFAQENVLPLGVSFLSERVMSLQLVCMCHGGWQRGLNSIPTTVFEWDSSGNTRILNQYWGPAVSAYLADTNERVWLSNENDECSDGNISGCVYDEIYYQMDGDEVPRLLSDDFGTAIIILFIENGEKLVLIDGFDGIWPKGFVSLAVINRAGDIEDFSRAAYEQVNSANNFTGSPTGFVYIAARESGDVLLQQDTRDLSQPPEVIWRSDLTGWEIIHADPFSVDGELPPFSEFRLE